MAGRIVFPAKDQVIFETFVSPPPGPGEVSVRSICSLMSTGTENIVLRQLFEPGTHWAGWVKYPFYPGYATIAEVEQIGPGVSTFKMGDRIATRAGHASHHTLKAEECYAIPKNIAPEHAAWFALAKITLHGALAAGYRLADRVLIIGAGPIGQMTIRWARAAGATRIVCIDKEASRLEMAARGGATTTFGISPEGATAQIIEAAGGALPRIVIDTTGNAAVFVHALKLTENHGKIILMGDTGTPSAQHLTADVITRGLSIVGAHDGAYPAGWNERLMYQTFFDLVASGRFDLSGLITHKVVPKDAADAYAITQRQRGQTMGVLFDWNNF